MTKTELCVLTKRRLLGRVADTGNLIENLFMLVPAAMDKLCFTAALSPSLREWMMFPFDLTVASGKANLTNQQIHRGTLCYARLYGTDDAEQLYPHIWKEAHAWDGWMDPTFGYFTWRANELLVRPRAVAEEGEQQMSAQGIHRLYALRIPFSAKPTDPGADIGWTVQYDELIDLASSHLAELYLAYAQAPQAMPVTK